MEFITFDDEHHRVAIFKRDRLKEKSAAADTAGMHHVAFTYGSLADLVATYKRLKAQGIVPVRTIHHGITVSNYYLDPDNNRVELQVNAFASKDKLNAWLARRGFNDNPIGVLFDFAELVERFDAGADPRPCSCRWKRRSSRRDPRVSAPGRRTLGRAGRVRYAHDLQRPRTGRPRAAGRWASTASRCCRPLPARSRSSALRARSRSARASRIRAPRPTRADAFAVLRIHSPGAAPEPLRHAGRGRSRRRIGAAFWGEVESNLHKALGCIGVVTDGAVRDIDVWASNCSSWQDR